MHLLGAKFLNSRIEMLESRDNLEAFTPGVAELRARLDRLRTLELQLRGVDLLTYEKSPTMPYSRISPRRTLITLLGLMLGVFAGCAIALIKASVDSHIAKQQSFRESDLRRVDPDGGRKDGVSYVLRADKEAQQRVDRRKNSRAAIQ
jgi:hypothetical protein